MARLPFGGVAGSFISTPQTKILVIPIGSYEATVAEASKLFSIPVGFQDGTTIAYYIIEFDGGVNAVGTMELRFRINADASASYISWGYRRVASTGVQTAVALVATNQAVIADVTTLSAVDTTFMGKMELYIADVGGVNDGRPIAFSQIIGINNAIALINQSMTHELNVDLGTLITSIEILASTNWKIGTRMTIYAVKRVDT